MARGVISDDAAARAMTHWPQEPNANVDAFKRGVSDFARGGVYGVLKGQGVDTPDWMDRAADAVNSQGVNDALGALPLGGTIKAMAPQAWRVQKLLAQGMSPEAIAADMGITPRAVGALGKMDVSGQFQKGTVEAPRWGRSQWAQNPELTERLLALRDQGKTPLEIAEELGTTRNAVIGRLDRLSRAPDKSAPDLSDWQVGPDVTLTRTVGKR